MRYLILVFSLALHLCVTGQEIALVRYKDKAQDFSIDMPATWKYNIKDEPFTFDAYQEMDTVRKIRINYSVSVIPAPGGSLRASVKKILFYMNQGGNLRIIDSGTIVRNGQQFVWIDQKHQSGYNHQDTMFSAVFITYSNSKAYVYNATIVDKYADQYKLFFHNIAESIKVGKANREEALKLVFSQPSAWQTLYDSESGDTRTIAMMPVGSTKEKWDTLITIISQRNGKINNVEQGIGNLISNVKSQNPAASITVLDKQDDVKGKWILLEADLPGPVPNAWLWYMVQGKEAVHMVYLTLKEKALPESVSKQWSTIFKKSYFIEE